MKYRSLAEIQRRGRWKAKSSMGRYCKSSKMLAATFKVDERFKTFVEAAHSEIAAILSGRRGPPKLPGTLGSSSSSSLQAPAT
eukprot:7382934-Lingulodinium_polyedra.AAC.1